MRIVAFIVSLLITTALVIALNSKLGPLPPAGKFVSPQHGFWQNAERKADYSNREFHFSNLKGKVSVYMDDRLVPHVFAENDEDIYFVQGYLHAKYRLWQMEFQTRAAAGRVSEIIGANPQVLAYDRDKRRLGMVYAAQNALSEVEKDPFSKMAGDAYTAGVNAYIDQLKESELPLEYKLLDYKPEKWSNLKTALLLKYMSLDLAGYEEDFERSNTRAHLDSLGYETMYEYGNDSLDPIVPKNTVFKTAGIVPKKPRTADSLYYSFTAADTNSIDETKPDKNNGSNNWAVSGSRTQSGRPILCNDPHLGLNLPSLWYEMQLHTPTYNAYGVTLPGAPSIIIGFNDSCAFGFTNAMRDVRDYYEITFKDDSKKEYLFNGQWQTATLHYDTIYIRGKEPFIDTVAYVKEFGPVMYDKSFTGAAKSGGEKAGGKYYAVRWKAHDPSNELLSFMKLNRAHNFDDYMAAISTFTCPGQNMIFAAKNGDIAIKQQGVFPAKWYRQGDFVMPGTDSSYMWQGMIPDDENYFMRNPERGFVSSANQYPYDTKLYPYYLGGNYPFTRGFIINRKLAGMTGIVPDDMKRLQNDNYNVFAEMLLPLLMKRLDAGALDADGQQYLQTLQQWNLTNNIDQTGATIFALWKDSLQVSIWADELAKVPGYVWPQETSLLDALRRDSAMRFIDNINTPQKETLDELVTAAFRKAVPELKKLEAAGRLPWGKHKATMVKHLLDKDRNMAFSRFNLPIGGGEHIINATKKDHGPSWKMIVQLTDKTEAYGVYPGGQSGNPGSPYYDSFIDTWANGNYYPLWVMSAADQADKRVKFNWQFSK